MFNYFLDNSRTIEIESPAAEENTQLNPARDQRTSGMNRPKEFCIMVEYDRTTKEIQVIKIGEDKNGSFFDFPSDCRDPKDHSFVLAHSQYKAFVNWIANNSPNNKEKYVRNLKFQSYKDGELTPEGKLYINGENQFRMKIGGVQKLATPESTHKPDETNINLNYSGRELLKRFGEFRIFSHFFEFFI